MALDELEQSWIIAEWHRQEDVLTSKTSLQLVLERQYACLVY